MKILVTGAIGQVGRFVIRRLIREHADFIGLDKRDSTEFEDIKLIHSEITNKLEIAKYENELKNVDVLIHLAGLITKDKDVVKSGPSSVDLNINGTLNLLEYLPSLEKICFSSTYMVYGTPQSNPVKEDHPTEPNLVYGASKLATEKYLQIFAREKKVKLSILRMMGIYNVEKPHGQAIPTFIDKILRNESPILSDDGSIRRNHLYIDDAVDAIMSTISNPVEGVFNIGGLDSPSNLELVKIINKKLGKSVNPVFQNSSAKVYDFVTDISKAKNELQFFPKVGIEEGLEKTIERITKKVD